jgi:hypothetical protein
MNKFSCYDYPLVIKKHMGHITISVPDLGITLVEDLSLTQKFDQASTMKVGKMVLTAWLKAQKHLTEKAKSKKTLAQPSNIRGSVSTAMRDLTPMGFAKFVSVSKDTILRDCLRGIIHCRRTTGGHYKIPSSEIAIYKEYLKNHVKFARESWAIKAVENMRNQSVDTSESSVIKQ